MQDLCHWHNQQASHYQFTPALAPARVAQTNARFYALRNSHNDVLACMALWNQQPFKQVVAQTYRAPLAQLLPLYNLLARLMRRVELPQMGRAFNHSFMAFFACARDVGLPQVLALVEDALARCATPVLTLGLQAQHPYLPALLRHFKPLHYRTRIYAVHFEEPPALDGRMAQPEVATL